MILDIGGLRRTWLRGVENVEKRYLIQVAAYNLGLVIRHRFGAGTPRQAMETIWFVFPGPAWGDLPSRRFSWSASGKTPRLRATRRSLRPWCSPSQPKIRFSTGC